MKRIVCKNYEELSRAGVLVFARQIWEKPKSVLGFATGGTPVGLYDGLAAMYEDGVLDFSRVTTFNLDEYYPIEPADEQSYRAFMWKHLFSRVNLREERIHLLDGRAADPRAACEAYEQNIRVAGGIDLQLLGIGHNGHIAFNEPADELPVHTGVVTLTGQTIDANARFFGSRDLVPRRALSMGLGSILAARRIVMLIAGRDKAPAVQKMFSGTVTPQVPASLLQLHPDVLVLLDEAAAGR